MNRLNIATFCVQKLNVPSLLSQAGDFTQRNYEMVYDKHNWRDVELRYSDTLLANQNDVALNVNCSRVASIMANGKVLDPVNAVQAMQVDPTFFSRTGDPEVYEEVTDVNGNHFIRMYPKPTMNIPLTVVGIKLIAQMGTDSSVSAIRNIDNVLIAYVEADLLERGKQYGMAKSKRADADALLATAIELDTSSRSNFPREVKPLSVTGGTLIELVDAVCARAKSWSPETRVLVTEILRRNYVELIDMAPWRECQLVRLVSAPGGSQVILPKEFESVMDVWQNDQVFSMLAADQNYFFNLDPTQLDLTNTGLSTHYVMLENVAVPVAIPSPEQIGFDSTSDNDLSYVFIKGELSGVEQSETVKLAGSSVTIETVNSYDTIFAIGKEVTDGDITVSGNLSGLIYDTYPAAIRSRSYVRFQLYRNAGKDLNLFVHGKRHVLPFVKDGDKPMLRGCSQALVYMTLAEALPLIGGDAAALAPEYGKKAESAVKNLMDRELRQNASKSRIVPLITDFNGRSGSGRYWRGFTNH